MIGGNIGAAIHMLKVMNQQGGASQSWEPASANLAVSWIDDFARLTWDSLAGYTYEVYESVNDGTYTLVDTTADGATSYDNYTSQNASMKFKIRGLKGGTYTDYTSEVSLTTPLVWKTDQSSLTTVTIAELYVSAGNSSFLNWGDGSSSQEVTGNATNITHNYTAEGQYFISMTNAGEILRFVIYNQSHLYGDLTKWKITRFAVRFRLYNCLFSGDISDWIIPTGSTQLYNNLFEGKIPDCTDVAGGAYITLYGNYLSGSNLVHWRCGPAIYDFKDQNVSFTTEEIDNLLKSAADFYEINTPYGDLTLTLTGNRMGVPTGGNSNVDKVRIEGYYTAAGYAATINVNAPIPFDAPKLMITFDGNVESIYTDAFPVLVSKSAKATVYVWPDGLGEAGMFSWANCTTMAASGIDIQDHSKDHIRMTDKNEAELIADFEAVDAAFVANGFAAPDHIAYPFGTSNALVESVTALYRQTGRKYTPDVWEQWKNLTPLAVGCYTIDTKDIEDIKDVLDLAIASNALIVTLLHTGQSTKLAAMIDYALAGGMDIITVSEMYALL